MHLCKRFCSPITAQNDAASEVQSWLGLLWRKHNMLKLHYVRWLRLRAIVCLTQCCSQVQWRERNHNSWKRKQHTVEGWQTWRNDAKCCVSCPSYTIHPGSWIFSSSTRVSYYTTGTYVGYVLGQQISLLYLQIDRATSQNKVAAT